MKIGLEMTEKTSIKPIKYHRSFREISYFYRTTMMLMMMTMTSTDIRVTKVMKREPKKNLLEAGMIFLMGILVTFSTPKTSLCVSMTKLLEQRTNGNSILRTVL